MHLSYRAEKIPLASASNPANPSMLFLSPKSAEKLAAHQERAFKKRTVAISDIMAHRFVLLKVTAVDRADRRRSH